MDYASKAREVFETEIAELARTRDALDGMFSRAVSLLLERLTAGGKIVLTGVGKNIPIAQKIAATLTSTGAPAVFLHPSDAMHGDVGILLPQDTVLAFSYSGASDELLALLPAIRRNGVPIIAFTAGADSPLARASALVLDVRVQREACPFNLAPTSSTTVALVLGDALAMVLLEARGFKREDYARLHPGGAIGRALLIRVRDIMRTGDRLACVPRSGLVRDAVLAMTRARAGAVAVVEPDGRLAGVFTDGDLRRHIDGPAPVADLPMERVMTPSPIRVRADALAAEVLAVFEKHNIDDLVVVDERDHLVGMVDLQDLPKMKIL